MEGQTISNNIIAYRHTPEANIWTQEDENGDWRRLHNEELHSLYCSSYIVRVVKCRRLRWVGHVPRVEEGRSALKIVTGKPTRRDLWGGLGFDRRTILEWTLKR